MILHSGSVDFAESIRAEIKQRVSESAGRKDVVWRTLRTVLADAGGWSRKGSSNIRKVEAALDSAGVFRDCEFAGMDLDEPVYFALHPLPKRVPVPRFVSERALIDFIKRNYLLLFKDVPELSDVDLVGAEVEFQTSSREERPDLVFRNSDRRFVVVEVEVGDPQENSAFQVLKYMNAADASLGVLITARPSSASLETNVREALDLMKPEKPNVWLMYDVSLLLAT